MSRTKPGPRLSVPCFREQRNGDPAEHARCKSALCQCLRHRVEPSPVMAGVR